MKSITIHSMDEGLFRLLKEKAETQQTSLNKTIKQILSETLNPGGKKKTFHRNDFLDLFGTWSEADEKEFFQSISDLEEVHEEDWK